MRWYTNQWLRVIRPVYAAQKMTSWTGRTTVRRLVLSIATSAGAVIMASPWSAEAATSHHRPPQALTLPAAIAPVTSTDGGWQASGAGWRLPAGKPGYLEAPAWWRGTRPARGEALVLEVDYLDDFQEPVVAAIYSGLGTLQPYSELHRFGGMGDGRQKTARIPVTSDFIFRHRPTDTIRFRLLPEEGVLTVTRFRLVAARPDEEDRYNGETRAWIARKQQRAVVHPGYFQRTRPTILPEDWSDKPLVPFARTWMEIVRPISTPPQNEVGKPLRVRMALNEYEPIQLGIHANGRDLQGVEVTVDPVRDETGADVANVDVRVAEYAKVAGQTIPDYLVEPFPQRLWPAYPFDVDEGRSHMVWLIVHTMERLSRAGHFVTNIRIRARGIPEVTVPLKIEIVDIRLLSMEEAGLTFGGCMRSLMPEFELEILRRYNHNSACFFYYGTKPDLSNNEGELTLDFALMDD